jgi:hypothetical protein
MEDLRKVKESSTMTSQLGVHLPVMQLSSGLVKIKLKGLAIIQIENAIVTDHIAPGL